MAAPIVSIEGEKKLRASLKKAGHDLSELKEAHRVAAEIVNEAAIRLAPVRTGALKKTLRAAGTNTMAVVRGGYKRTPYAPPIHWGWPKRNIEANPFISEAATATEHIWITAYEQHVEKAIEKIKGK